MKYDNHVGDVFMGYEYYITVSECPSFIDSRKNQYVAKCTDPLTHVKSDTQINIDSNLESFGSDKEETCKKCKKKIEKHIKELKKHEHTS